MNQLALNQQAAAMAATLSTPSMNTGASEPLPSIFLGRQPIIDRDQNLVAFELLFRTGYSEDADVSCNFSATADVIVNAFGQLGLRQTLGPHRGFLNVDRDMLASDLVALLPPQQIVLELLETIEVNDAVIERCKKLRRAGYRLALDDVTAIDDRVKALLPIAHMLKIDVAQVDSKALPRLVAALKHLPVLLVAEKVHTREQATSCHELGFDLFQGYYFARPEVVSAKRPDPSKMGLLRVMKLLSKDAEVRDIEAELKQYPDLVYNLMRIVNSAASGFTKKIDSLHQCIVVLGRSKLHRWVQLLLYNAPRRGPKGVNPLMHIAATRGKWMETLAAAERPRDRTYHDRAFMVGVLSLLETLIGLPMSEMVDDLNLDDEVADALLDRVGALGYLLNLLDKKECNDIPAVTRLLKGLPNVTLEQFTAAELDAAGWANGITYA